MNAINSNYVNYEELAHLYSRNAINKLSKNPKKEYKNGLVAIFVSSFMVGDYGRRVFEYNGNIAHCKDVLKNPRAYLNEETVKRTEEIVQIGLRQIFVKNPNSEETKNNIISLMRKIIEYQLDDARYLMLYDELNDLLDVVPLVRKLWRNPNPNLSNHHWFELDIEKGLVHTFPEFIVYGNLTSLWNMYLDKANEVVRQAALPVNRKEKRRLENELQALQFSLWIQAVTFTESYLYYVFYNVQKSNYPLSSNKAKDFINKEKPEDDQIVKQLILTEFNNEDNKEQIKVIKELHIK